MKKYILSSLFFFCCFHTYAGNILFEIENEYYSNATKLEVGLHYKGKEPETAPTFEFEIPAITKDPISLERSLSLEEDLEEIVFVLCNNERGSSQEELNTPSNQEDIQEYTAPTIHAMKTFKPDKFPLKSLKAILKSEKINILATYFQEQL